MKNFLITIIKGIISFIVLVFFIIISWAAIIAMLKSFDESFSNVDKTVVLAIVSALVSIITLLISKSIDRNLTILSEKKKVNQPKYQELIADILSSSKSRSTIKEEYSSFVFSHSNDEIYNEFMKYCDTDNSSYEKLFVAIRRELKLTNKTLQKQYGENK